MSLWDVKDLAHYWERYPPVGELVAAAVGFKLKTESAPPLTETSLASIAASVNSAAQVQGVQAR